MLMHSYMTEISIAHIGWLTKSSLSKHTNGGGPSGLRLAKKCLLKIFSISSLRSARSQCWSSNFIVISRLNWSYFVNTAITGTRKMPHFDCQFIKLCLDDVPFLSRQISPKCFKSSSGRLLTIEMQYLKRNPCECTVTDTERYKPYRMQSLLQFFLLRLLTDKLLHSLQLVFAASLEATRVVENITFMTWKDDFVLDVMLATLRAGSSLSAVTDNLKNKPAQPLGKPRVEPS